MKIAIVGSQGKSFNEAQERNAIELIELILSSWGPGNVPKVHTLVSGGEPTGVDRWAEDRADWDGWDKEIFHPATRDWEGFRARNIQVAEAADVLYAIRSNSSKTYGSGWTADYAEGIGKKVHRYYV